MPKPNSNGEAAIQAFIDLLADRVAERVAEKLGPRTLPNTRLLTLKETGALIGRTAGAVAQLVNRGDLQAIRHGRRIHIEQREIEGWIERGRD